MNEALSPRRVSDVQQFAARYRQLRPVQFRINNLLVTRLTKDVLHEGGKKLGILRGGTLYFDNEDQSSVLMDYCIYNVARKGRNAVEQYLCDHPPNPDSNEMTCLRAMQHATYALLVVLSVERNAGCYVRNLFTDETRLLIDIGLSNSAVRGAIIATRVLDFGEYVTTGGAILPMGVLNDEQLTEWQRELQRGVRDDDFDPAPLICKGLQSSSEVVYHEPNARVQPPASRAERSERRQRLRESRQHKWLDNRRCRCGSGKMYKNCCGKH